MDWVEGLIISRDVQKPPMSPSGRQIALRADRVHSPSKLNKRGLEAPRSMADAEEERRSFSDKIAGPK